MASVFKLKNKNSKHDPYLIEFSDDSGKRRRVVGYTDKRLSEQKGMQLEREAKLRRDGLVDQESEKKVAHRAAPIESQLSSYENSFVQVTEKHKKLTMSRIRRVCQHGCIETLQDIDIESVVQAILEIQEEDELGNKTVNHYMQAIDSFCNWCVPNRLDSNPLHGMKRLNAEVDVRRKRRALSSDEMSMLLESARNSGKSIQCYTGEERARFYFMSYMTGLRRKELASLTPESFDLAAKTPTVTVQAACSKHRREDVLPLHPALVAELLHWIAPLGPTDELFPLLDRRRTWLCVKKDLERIGIPYRNADGVADFHAAGRHSHITGLIENGASLAEACELARHSDVRMTMRYTHIGLDSQAKALAALPAPSATKDNDSVSRFLRSQDRLDGHSEESLDTDRHDPEKKLKETTPDEIKSYDVLGRDMSQPGTSSAQMEAAGIEPASRYASMKASTCVVGYLAFRLTRPLSTGLTSD